MAKESEEKIILEREYVVPLRRKWQNTPEYKRVPKAIKALKEFIARHMKVAERDIKNVRIDRYLNLEMWSRGIRKPKNKIKVRAKKLDSGIVRVELTDIPEFWKWKIEREKKRFILKAKESKEKTEEVKTKETEEESEKKQEIAEEKKAAVKEAGLIEAERRHKEAKHEVVMKKGIKKPLARKTLQK